MVSNSDPFILTGRTRKPAQGREKQAGQQGFVRPLQRWESW